MPGERLPMRKIRDVLRLHAEGMSKRKIAASLSIGATAAGEGVRRAKRADLTWPLPEQLSDDELERLLYPPPQITATDRRPQPDWPTIHRELRRPGVTLQLLWEEHRSVHPDGYGYSRYVELFRDWERRLSPTMRQVHVAGERMFVDYAGTKLELVDGTSGEACASCSMRPGSPSKSMITKSEPVSSTQLHPTSTGSAPASADLAPAEPAPTLIDVPAPTDLAPAEPVPTLIDAAAPTDLVRIR